MRFPGKKKGGGEAYEPQGDDADDVHEDVAAFAEDNGVERDEGLGRAKREESVGVGL